MLFQFTVANHVAWNLGMVVVFESAICQRKVLIEPVWSCWDYVRTVVLLFKAPSLMLIRLLVEIDRQLFSWLCCLSNDLLVILFYQLCQTLNEMCISKASMSNGEYTFWCCDLTKDLRLHLCRTWLHQAPCVLSLQQLCISHVNELFKYCIDSIWTVQNPVFRTGLPQVNSHV